MSRISTMNLVFSLLYVLKSLQLLLIVSFLSVFVLSQLKADQLVQDSERKLSSGKRNFTMLENYNVHVYP